MFIWRGHPMRCGVLKTLFTLSVLLVCVGCAKKLSRETVTPENFRTLNHGSPFLKAHLLNGEVYVLGDWRVDEKERMLYGDGTHLGINRQKLESGLMAVPIDSVALFETNRVVQSPSVGAVALLTGASLAVTVVCLTNPKACFGSCPTFYATNGEKELLQAEGFSASVAPSLEATDIDALYRTRPSSQNLTITMTNEALETHVVRRVSLLVAKRPEGGRVAVDLDRRLREVYNITSPSSCVVGDEDCLSSVKSFDGRERFSQTDSTDLASKETIELTFDEVPDGSRGLLIASRQSLLSTYLFYQTLSYLGTNVAEFISMLERGDISATSQSVGLGEQLGGIELMVENANGTWVTVSTTHETGPLATDIRLMPIPDSIDFNGKIRLRLTRGHWRLDYLALASVGDFVEPVRLEPRSVVMNTARVENPKELLIDSSQFLITYPGDTCRLEFVLPEDYASYELFLESRGYYLEWMRDEWLAEENAERAMLMLMSPEQALRTLAPEYKEVESEMENCFWNSRYVK
ncbi:MAG: hypothetical protein AB1483_03050 [Candidatus Zixiibacteriota bacterium]